MTFCGTDGMTPSFCIFIPLRKKKIIKKTSTAIIEWFTWIWNEKMQISTRRDLLQEASNIGDLKRYNMMLQNISIAPNVKNYLNNNRTTPK